ncbi:signal recognition particle receptor FtsY [Aureimonas sp. SA4125]|uniref:signal recognition particle-docking protein FtsY n=1 Tax=Aureimonas sp. SA4125 TaxID=2826993 RepID=UPI001CC7E177|nr:signal recognition particle-docking protein FtsY [Aureimonas sp. SA4125]BDA86652.1 signal recognition particle receptor FtsY [Aureimonas sp. SA4125]
MSEKKGFFRRVFSFGAAEETSPAPEAARSSETLLPTAEAADPERRADEVAPVAGVPAPPEEELRPVPASIGALPLTPSDESALAAGYPATAGDDARGRVPAGGDAPGPGEPAGPTATGETAFVAADMPEWLDPAAPEPETDFSWLDADVPSDEFSEETFSVDGTSDEVVLPGRVLHEEPGEDGQPLSETPTGDAVADADDEPDFSFLDPEAPLPEEPADFSWLETPVDDTSADETVSPSGVVASVAAAGIAAATASASPGAADAGWRLREAAAPAPAAPAAPKPWLERLREGLARSSGQLSGQITALFTKRRLDEATLQEFEDVLIQADLGVETALRITDRLSEGRFGKEITGSEVRAILADEVEATLRPVALPLELDLEKKPHVILVVGVNGTGKTTTIGKLAAKLTRGGLKVTLCAGDTFRAAAVEQLKIWGERTGSEVIAKAIGADAAGLAFEAYDAAVANGSDVLIIDTAGRLQNRTELMAELEKIVRVLQRREPDAPHTVLQTLDATTGQNALSQVEIFRNVAGVNGLVMTKLDGTARGGILVAIAAKYRLPVYFIGVGEGIDDLEPFKAREFAMAIAGQTA